MNASLANLTFYVGEIENSVQAYIHSLEKNTLSFALSGVAVFLALYENEHGFDHGEEAISFEDFVSSFTVSKNTLEDRGDNLFDIQSIEYLTDDEADAFEMIIGKASSIQVVHADSEFRNLFELVKATLAKGEDVTNTDLEAYNHDMHKAVMTFKGLVDEGFTEWSDEVLKKFIDRFG